SKFLCIKDVVMSDGDIAYRKGEIYQSDFDECITDIQGARGHYWVMNREGEPDLYFKPLEEVDRVYTEATDRLRELHRNYTGDKIGDPDKADYFDNKDSNHGYFSFSAQWGLEKFYKEMGYDYVSEEVFIKLNGLEEKTYEEDPYSWVNNGIREAGSRKEVNINTQPHYDKPKQYAKGIDTFARMEANCTKE